MPAYTWLAEWSYTPEDVGQSLRALQTIGTPYTDEQIDNVATLLADEAQLIVDDLADDGITTAADKEIVALIAYLQRLGRSVPVDLTVADGEEG